MLIASSATVYGSNDHGNATTVRSAPSQHAQAKKDH